MKITREKACQRLHHRVRTPLRIRINDRDYSAVDWSLGGFRLSNWPVRSKKLSIGENCLCNLELPFQGFNIDFDIEVTLLRIDKTQREAAFCFVELTERQTELMSHFIEQLVRGAMTPVQDTILRIDSPVTPVSTKPDPSPTGEVPVKRFSAKKWLMSVVYLAVGTFLAAVASVTVYENFLSLKVKTAVVHAPVEPLISLVDGRVQQVNTAINHYVEEGDPLFQIDSPNLKKRIDEAKIAVEQKKVELQERRKKHALAIETSGSPASKEARVYEIEVDRLEQEITLATQQLVALYEYKDNLSIFSPGSGRLVKLLRGRGALVRRGDTVGLFERSLFDERSALTVHAYISHQQSTDVRINQQVQIRGSGRHWQGIVVSVHDSHVQLAGEKWGYRPENSASKDTLVEIELLSVTTQEQLSVLRPGMPVEVLFPAESVEEFWRWVRSEPDELSKDTERTVAGRTQAEGSI